jgi:ankyrin repeat protein
MTSNGDEALNASSAPTGTAHDRPHSPRSPRHAPKAASPSKENHLPPHDQNGHDEDQDAEGESEAETVVLSRDENPEEKKVIKTERSDDDDDTTRLRSIKEESRPHSPQTNGRRRSSNSNHVRINGAKHGSERDAKSPIPTSPSSRTTSRHTKDTSPTDSAKSPVQSALSPVQATSRGRSASTVDNRKRKLRDDLFPKSFEPPRQRPRTEGLKESRQPSSPATPRFGRPHKRSQSTQSAITGIAGRKRREVTNLALSTEEHWSGSSSDHSTSPQPTLAPHLQQHVRVKRSSHRALTSPARTMPQRKIDRFGATRLARESEKGDLEAVKEAFEEAPDELDQPDYAGITPLQKAALHGWAPVVRYLISKGCRTDCESHDRDTPLIDAVENSHLEVVTLLLDQGQVNPHHANKKGQRAIDVLDPEDEDAEEIEKELRNAMRHRVDTSSNDHERSQKQAKTASRLLYNEFNVETLIEKAGDGDILAVGELINSNIKPNITCGVAAARGGHYDILSILLASGLKADPDPSKHPETPMTVAIGRGYLKIIQLLLEQDNFNPTRRNKEHKTYWEISAERHGPKWEEERDMLKRACEEYMGTHRSPRRTKKEAPNPSGVRMKRKSPPRRDRSSSPRHEAKRAHLTKPTTLPAPQKPRRLMSGVEKATREGQRRKRVVDDETSEEESEEDVRPPTRKMKHRSYSEGEEAKPVRKALKARPNDNDSKRPIRAQSDDSDEDHGTKQPVKIRKKSAQPLSAKPTPEIDSPDERKVVKNKIKYKTVEDKIRKRKLSDASADDISVKRTPTASAKSTPAPPERFATPEVERARRQEEHRLQAEAKRKAAEAAAEDEARQKEAKESARQAAEEDEAKRNAEAEAKAQRRAEEAKAARKREEEETRRRAEESQRRAEESQRRAQEEAKRQEELLARQHRISKLPRALRRACELGTNRPLHFSGEELGVSAVFLPLFYANAHDLHNAKALPNKTYICSFQLVGILGLPELDLAHLSAPYSDWTRIPVSHQQRDAILRQYDVALLAQDFRFPMEGAPDFDYAKIQDSIKEAKNQFSAMEGLYWVEESLLYDEVEKVETLRPLLQDMRAECKRRRIHLDDLNVEQPEKKSKPRKSFMDIVFAQNGVNGVAPTVNGNG